MSEPRRDLPCDIGPDRSKACCLIFMILVGVLATLAGWIVSMTGDSYGPNSNSVTQYYVGISLVVLGLAAIVCAVVLYCCFRRKHVRALRQQRNQSPGMVLQQQPLMTSPHYAPQPAMAGVAPPHQQQKPAEPGYQTGYQAGYLAGYHTAVGYQGAQLGLYGPAPHPPGAACSAEPSAPPKEGSKHAEVEVPPPSYEEVIKEDN